MIDAPADIIGRNLAMSIDPYDDIARCERERLVETGRDDSSGVVNDLQLPVLHLKRREPFARPISRHTVGNNDFQTVLRIVLCEHCAEAALDESSLVPDRHYDRD